MDLVPKNVGKSSTNGLMDAILIGTVKAVEERIAAPVIGNATLKSGIIKLAAGSILETQLKGKAGHIVGSALAIDGIEDVVQGAIVPIVFGSSKQTSNNNDSW